MAENLENISAQSHLPNPQDLPSTPFYFEPLPHAPLQDLGSTLQLLASPSPPEDLHYGHFDHESPTSVLPPLPDCIDASSLYLETLQEDLYYGAVFGVLPQYTDPIIAVPPPQAAWTWAETKWFEVSLAASPPAPLPGFAAYVANIPGKTYNDAVQHYCSLMEDVYAIENGSVQIPCYTDGVIAKDENQYYGSPGNVTCTISHEGQEAIYTTWTPSILEEICTEQQPPAKKKKGEPWTEDEHKDFLKGLEEVGKGDWRAISRNYVKSKMPQQVASHAQKYFLRRKDKEEGTKRKINRKSIHDITKF